MGILLIPFYYIHVPEPFGDNASGTLSDAVDAFAQMGNNPLIILALVGEYIVTVKKCKFNCSIEFKRHECKWPGKVK